MVELNPRIRCLQRVKFVVCCLHFLVRRHILGVLFKNSKQLCYRVPHCYTIGDVSPFFHPVRHPVRQNATSQNNLREVSCAPNGFRTMDVFHHSPGDAEPEILQRHIFAIICLLHPIPYTLIFYGRDEDLCLLALIKSVGIISPPTKRSMDPTLQSGRLTVPNRHFGRFLKGLLCPRIEPGILMLPKHPFIGCRRCIPRDVRERLKLQWRPP